MRIQLSRYRIGVSLVIILMVLCACAGEGSMEPTPVVLNPARQVIPSTTPAPTATVYIPEGQLLFENFESLADDFERIVREGIVQRKAPYGIEIEVSTADNYFLVSGLGNVNDANLTTFALPVTAPAQTTAFLACRVLYEDEGKDVTENVQAYVAYFRFDGAYRLQKRRIAAPDEDLTGWQTGASVNDAGVFNNLYLLCDGARILFIVNGEVLFDVQDAELKEGDFALGVADPGEGNTSIVNFDKFSLFEP